MLAEKDPIKKLSESGFGPSARSLKRTKEGLVMDVGNFLIYLDGLSQSLRSMNLLVPSEGLELQDEIIQRIRIEYIRRFY